MLKILGGMMLVVAVGGLLEPRGPAQAGRHTIARGPADAGPDVQAGSAATFTVGTATAMRGQLARGVITVPAGVDAGYDIPVAVIHGARPGPVLAVMAGSHGTEYASIMAVEQLIDAIRPATVAGTVILVPLINIGSYEQIVPHVNPADGKSMNGTYPGNPNGTQSDRAAYALTKAVVEPCDHLIDLHGGDLDENLRPYSYWTVTGNQKQDEASRAMVLAFGLNHIIISADRPKDPNASRYLENTASTRGKASITAEAGRSGPVDPADVAMLVRGVRNVMAHLKMTTDSVVPVANPIWIERVVSIAAEQKGMFIPSVDRDAHVTKGTKIGVITDYLHQPLQEITAPEDGIVLFVRAVPTLKKGNTLANLGVVKK